MHCPTFTYYSLSLVANTRVAVNKYPPPTHKSLTTICPVFLNTQLMILVSHIVMDWPMRRRRIFLFAAFLVVAAGGAQAYSTVAGTVFCDQCKDGSLSIFDYPMNGMKVALTCKDSSSGEVRTWGEETTNIFGGYSMRVDGTPDLSGCQAHVSGNGKGCGAVAGSPKNPTLLFRMFDLAMYSVDPLLTQPFQPTSSSCPRSALPPVVVVPPPVTPVASPPPLKKRAPVSPRLPPLPRLPPMPRVPFFEASACQYREWTMPQHKCYWRVVAPDMKVAVVFGLVAARRYGTDMTVWHGMQGRGDPYRTLLREAITALLNSYNSLQFPYNPLSVVQQFNVALMGGSSNHDQRQVLHTALRFMRANSGNGKVSCRFTPCTSN